MVVAPHVMPLTYTLLKDEVYKMYMNSFFVSIAKYLISDNVFKIKFI